MHFVMFVCLAFAGALAGPSDTAQAPKRIALCPIFGSGTNQIRVNRAAAGYSAYNQHKDFDGDEDYPDDSAGQPQTADSDSTIYEYECDGQPCEEETTDDETTQGDMRAQQNSDPPRRARKNTCKTNKITRCKSDSDCHRISEKCCQVPGTKTSVCMHALTWWKDLDYRIFD